MRLHRTAALCALSGLLLLPLAACGSAEEETVADAPASADQQADDADDADDADAGSAKSWRESVRTGAFEGSEGCTDLVPEATLELIEAFTGPTVESASGHAEENDKRVTCYYHSEERTSEERELRITVDPDRSLCNPAPDAPEIHADPPTEVSDSINGEDVEMRLTDVTICTESGVGLAAGLGALGDSAMYDSLADNESTTEILQSLAEHEAQVVDGAMTLREEVLAAEE